MWLADIGMIGVPAASPLLKMGHSNAELKRSHGLA
ncbi:MAG: hypothetical protein ACJAVR_003202 [Paracoccaceae bacterium]|jgi:hypothetical protein